jgi:hypothetical protein
MKAVFIDECKSKKFTLTAVFVDVDHIPGIRKSLARHRLKGQSRIHFVDESNSRRRAILATLSKHEFQTKFYVAEVDRESEARRRCLQALIETLVDGSSYQIWLELDENHLLLDRQTLSAEMANRQIDDFVVFRHESARNQTLLWIPDALGWVRNRGGEWLQALEQFPHEIKLLD